MHVLLTNIKVEEVERAILEKWREHDDHGKYANVAEEAFYVVSAAAAALNEGNDALYAGGRLLSSLSLSLTKADNHAGSLSLSVSFAPVEPTETTTGSETEATVKGSGELSDGTSTSGNEA